MGQTGPEVALALADQPAGNLIPGAPVDISKDDAVLQQVLLNATYLYNNQSNDAFLFKPSAIIRAQRQVGLVCFTAVLSPCSLHPLSVSDC